MYRVEDKYALSPLEMELMQKRIETLLPADHSSGRLGYQIGSVYFDDLFDTHLHDTVEGNPIAKAASEITYGEMRALLAGDTVPCSGDPDDPRTAFNLAIRTRGLRPKVIIAYERKAFIFQSGNVRITFDRNIRGSDRVDLFGDPTLCYDYPEDEGVILEVKYDELLPDFIAQTLENNAMWQTANSKYRICRELYTF